MYSLGVTAKIPRSGGEGDDILTGGYGRDIFVLAAEDGTDLILDFRQRADLIGLVGELTFGSNVSTQVIDGETLLLAEGETLARLKGEFALTVADFTSL